MVGLDDVSRCVGSPSRLIVSGEDIEALFDAVEGFLHLLIAVLFSNVASPLPDIAIAAEDLGLLLVLLLFSLELSPAGPGLENPGHQEERQQHPS